MVTAAAPATRDPDRVKDEWQECRTTIGRFDDTIADLWKYGFTFVTTLITASAFLVGDDSNRASAATAAAIVLAILTTGLFAIERYFVVLRAAAVGRARECERRLDMQVTSEISVVARRTEVTVVEPILFLALLYALFKLVQAPDIEPWVVGCAGFVVGYWFFTELVISESYRFVALMIFLAYACATFAAYRLRHPELGRQVPQWAVGYALAGTGYWLYMMLFRPRTRTLFRDLAGFIVLWDLVTFLVLLLLRPAVPLSDQLIWWLYLLAAVVWSGVEVTGVFKPSEEKIRKRAYEIYLCRGKAQGQDLDDWYKAECELKEMPLGTIFWRFLKCLSGLSTEVCAGAPMKQAAIDHRHDRPGRPSYHQPERH
jgi:hypothetical protein